MILPGSIFKRIMKPFYNVPYIFVTLGKLISAIQD
jgi:hypothetical protein